MGIHAISCEEEKGFLKSFCKNCSWCI